MGQVHEFTLFSFRSGVEPDRQLLIMEALGHHLARCSGLIERQFFRSEDERWVEHVVWASQMDLEASAGIEEDAVVSRLFDCLDPGTVAYARCERVELDSFGTAVVPAVP